MYTTEYKGTLLALDTASRKTGYAIFRNGEVIKSGTWKLKEKSRFADLLQNIEKTVSKYHITQIVAEDIFKSKEPQKTRAYQVLCECRGIVECVAQNYELPCTFISPIEVKKHIWGMRYKAAFTREQQKRAMIKAITERYGYTLASSDADDEADAIGILVTFLDNKSCRITHPRQ